MSILYCLGQSEYGGSPPQNLDVGRRYGKVPAAQASSVGRDRHPAVGRKNQYLSGSRKKIQCSHRAKENQL